MRKLVCALPLLCILVSCSNGSSGGNDGFIVSTETEVIEKTVDSTRAAEAKSLYAWAHDHDAAFELYKKGELPKYDSYSVSSLRDDYDGYIYAVNDNNEFGIFFAPNGLATKTSFQVEGGN